MDCTLCASGYVMQLGKCCLPGEVLKYDKTTANSEFY